VSTISAARDARKASIGRTRGNAGGGGEGGGGVAERGHGDEVRAGGARVDGPGRAHRPAPPAGTSRRHLLRLLPIAGRTSRLNLRREQRLGGPRACAREGMTAPRIAYPQTRTCNRTL
jgi:hypothetical protein